MLFLKQFLRAFRANPQEWLRSHNRIDEIVELLIHNVTPRFVREIHEMGFTDLPIDELVELNIHHVTPRFIREMRQKYGEQLSIQNLLDMRIHGVDEDLLEELRSAGISVSK